MNSVGNLHQMYSTLLPINFLWVTSISLNFLSGYNDLSVYFFGISISKALYSLPRQTYCFSSCKVFLILWICWIYLKLILSFNTTCQTIYTLIFSSSLCITLVEKSNPLGLEGKSDKLSWAVLLWSRFNILPVRGQSFHSYGNNLMQTTSFFSTFPVSLLTSGYEDKSNLLEAVCWIGPSQTWWSHIYDMKFYKDK